MTVYNDMQLQQNTTAQTKRAALVAAMALMVVYVLTYMEQTSSFFHFARITAAVPGSSRTVFTRSNATNNATSSSVSDYAIQCQEKGQQLARSFVNSQHKSLSIVLGNYSNSLNHATVSTPYWCTHEAYDKKSCKTKTQMLCQPKGLLFVKTPKTGSTTISRIMKRIVQQVAQRSTSSSNTGVCQHREDHVNGAGLWYGNRDPDHSFLLTSVRDPAQRAISRFFWSYVTRHPPSDNDNNNNNSNNNNNNSTYGQSTSISDDAFIQDYLNKSTAVANGCTSKGQGGYQLNYITMDPIPEWSAWSPQTPTAVRRPQLVERNVQKALQEYDFMVVNERMDESLVVLQLLLGLEPSDILSLSFNVGGSYRYEHGKCKLLAKSYISPGIQAYLESDEWYAKNYGDYLLWEAANRSLDMTIDALGRTTHFAAAMQEFQRLESKVNSICPQQVPFPCSANGTVLFHTDQPVPHAKIDECINGIVRQEVDEAMASILGAKKENEQ